MGKTSTLLGALLLSASGLTAQAQDEVNLTFSRTGSDASGISVNVTDENGEPVSGASATLTLKPNNVLTNGVLTSEKANVICPNQNKNANGSDIEFTISITGLPYDLTFNKVEATTWALTSNGVLQTYAGRYWNLSVQAGTSSDNLTATANLENFDLYNGPGNNTETLATTPSFILSSATSTDASGNLCIKFIANDGTKDPTIGCFIGLESINLSNKSTVTFNYVDSKGYTIAPSETVSVPMGQAYTVPDAPEIAHFTGGTPNPAVIDNPGATETVTYTYEWDGVLPFQTSTVSGGQWTGGEHWFTLFTRGTYWVYNSTDHQIDLKDASLSAPYADEALWCVADAGNGTYTLYNRAAGPGQALTVGGSTVTMGSGTAMELWYYRQNPDDPNTIPGGWCLNVPGGNNFLNKQNNKLTIWSSTAARGEIGSVVGFTDVLSDYAALRDEYTATANYVGGYSAEDLASSGLASATTVDAYNTAFTALNAAEVITIQPGQYYRIVNELRKAGETPIALTGGNASGSVGLGTATSAQNAGQLWQFEASGDGYKLRNANYALYAGTLDGSGHNDTHMPLVDEADAKVYTLTALGSACWKLADSGNSAHGGVMHCAPNNYIVAWNEGKGSASSWYIVPVTDIEVAMHSVDDADATDTWATLCLPFAVETPNGLTAYTGQADTQAGTVALTEIEDGLVPAGNGVVLKGSAETYTLAIQPDAEARTLEGNDLSGTTTAQPLSEAGTVYVLGKNNGTAGFYLPNEAQTELTANKAYLGGTPTQALAAGYRFVLGDDETTGIGSVQTPDGPTADQPCYDLQGRRVGQPRQGGVYIQGGKKVYIRK